MTAVSSTSWRGWHLAAVGPYVRCRYSCGGFTASPARRSRLGFLLRQTRTCSGICPPRTVDLAGGSAAPAAGWQWPSPATQAVVVAVFAAHAVVSELSSMRGTAIGRVIHSMWLRTG